ncbi:LysR family transcriptional regulator [Pseudomonas sp. Pc102]|uniref:LysR family transcriptional regulator n=1 Tax=Pseudomonas sp. Pc102 TaxID=2678261 RepID=UPI001BD0A2E9|nr:LysR family transcriptional regulator [Pseudomonas sp. Pc102]BBP83357.1 LysR family transcriptional regulator [Pseudomonas sp. Pc102]
MELSQLKMFKVTAEQGSIVKASKLLHCVPSNITNRIKLLEQELGVNLFLRKGRGLIISPSGELLLGYVNKILDTCEEAKRALDPEATPAGVLKIGAIESAATGRLPALLSRYHVQCPSVQMQFSTGTWSQLVAEVIGHKLDGAIIAVKSDHADIAQLEIYKEPLILIASESIGEITSADEVNNLDIFMWPEGCPYRHALERWLKTAHISTPITSIASYGTILGCVSAGAGVSLVPSGVFEQYKKIGNIKGYVFDDLTPIQNYFIWNKNIGLHRARDAFAELITDEFRNISTFQERSE